MALETIPYDKLMEQALREGASLAVRHQLPIIAAVRDGRTPGEAEGVTYKKDGSPVTPGDVEVQESIISRFREALGPKLYVHAEEDGVVNSCTEKEATMRLIIDPIDGTKNYSRGLQSNLTEATGRERQYPRTGWGIMVALQERKEGQWQSVAGGIYVCSAQDTPEQPKGIMYIGAEGKEGVTVTDLCNGSSRVVTAPLSAGKKDAGYYIGGFAHNSSRRAMDAAVAERTSAPAHNAGCVAQSVAAMLSGLGAVYMNEGPNRHDAAAGLYLLNKAGHSVQTLPLVQHEAEGKTYYPFIATDDAALTAKLAGLYTGSGQQAGWRDMITQPQNKAQR